MFDSATKPWRPSLRLSGSDWLLIIAAYLFSRAALYGFAYVGVRLYGDPSVELGPLRAYCQFDCVWFMRIIENGYDLYPRWLSKGSAANWAFMPFYPLLTEAIAPIFGGDTMIALMAVSNIGFFAGLPLMMLCLRQMRYDEPTVHFGVWLLAFSPFSAYFVSGYTEPLFITFMIGMFLFAYRQQWVWVAVFGFFISATRNLGVMMVFPILILALEAYGWRELLRFRTRTWEIILVLWIIPFGLFAYMFYLHHLTGDAFAFKNIQIAWGREIGSPLDFIAAGFEKGGRKSYLAAMVIFGWCLNAYLFWERRWAEGTLMFICCMIPLTTSLNAMPRYMFGLYPTLLAFILLGRRFPDFRSLILALSGMTASFIAVAFANAKFFTV